MSLNAALFLYFVLTKYQVLPGVSELLPLDAPFPAQISSDFSNFLHCSGYPGELTACH